VPGPDSLGSQWEDEGDPGTSLDLTNPPTPCAPFLAVLHSATEDALHEFSFLPTASGEQGHFNFAALRAPAATVSAELAAVAQPSYAQCAEASARRRFDETEQGNVGNVTARRIDLAIPGAHVIWRATVNFDADGERAMVMDVVFVADRDAFVKVRVTSCGCRPPVAGDSELLPGEINALRAIVQGFTPVTTG